MKTITSRQSLPKSNQGSVLIVAMLLAAIIAIALGSYISMSTNALKLSNRSFYENASMNLADSGLELGVYALNQNNWTGWDTSDGVNAKQTFTGFNYPQNTTGKVKVYIQNYSPGVGQVPVVTAQAIINQPDGSAPVTKMVEVTLYQRSYFANGLVAKNQVSFSGNNAGVNSWNSNPTNSSPAQVVPYSSSVAHDHGSVGSTTVTTATGGAVGLGNADIWGYAAVGGTTTASISVGPNGTIASFGSPQGTVDPTHITTDFTANFDTVTAPDTSSAQAVSAINGSYSLGTASLSTVYVVPSISLSGNNNTLTISGNVTLVVSAAAGSSAISVTGHGSIVVKPGSTLKVYTAGDISIAGDGAVNNATQPIDMQFWGTGTASQNISIAGNGILSAVVYAPNAAISMKGGGNSGVVAGAFVGNTIALTGNDAFHYDESLANFVSGQPYGITKWRELITASDRSLYASTFSGF